MKGDSGDKASVAAARKFGGDSIAGTESPDGSLITIGQLAALAGVSSRTIRYYEELGILPEPERSVGGTRRYSREHRFYIEGALALKDVGFALDEVQLIGKIALGRRVTNRQRAVVSKIIDERMSSLEHKINVLKRLRDILEEERSAGQSPWPLSADALGSSRAAGS